MRFQFQEQHFHGYSVTVLFLEKCHFYWYNYLVPIDYFSQNEALMQHLSILSISKISISIPLSIVSPELNSTVKKQKALLLKIIPLLLFKVYCI